MSLETDISGSADKLIDGLSFQGRNTASHITERKSCSFQPQSGGIFNPNGIRLMRFNLADQSGWLQGDTVRLALTIQKHRGYSVAADLRFSGIDDKKGAFDLQWKCRC